MSKLERAKRFLGAAPAKAALTVVPLALLAASAQAGVINSSTSCAGSGGCGVFRQLDYNTQLTDMNMTLDHFVMPVGPSFNPVEVKLTLGLNPNMPSLGHATATGGATGPNGDIANGDQFFVDSFFDVFFDVGLTNEDTNGGLIFGDPNLGLGASIHLDPPFSAHMDNQYFKSADTSLPDYGFIPPPAGSPYIGHLNVMIPLPFCDPSLSSGIFNNGCSNPNAQYEFAFKLAQHYVDGGSATFITLPDGRLQDTMNSAGYLAAGILHVGDTFDPPFTAGNCLAGTPGCDPANQGDPFAVGAFTGPTTAASSTPEPASALLLAGGFAAVLLSRRKRA